MSYVETLYAWATKHIPEGATVLAVDVYDNPGYHYSSYTFEDPHVEVWIDYVRDGVQFRTSADVESLGQVLTELFAIEEPS